MIKLLIYDLDGTLIDSRLDLANSINWALGQVGLRPLPVDRVMEFIGHGLVRLVEQSVRESHGEPDQAILEKMISVYRKRYDEHLLDETKLYPSVRRVLEHFKSRKQAVITNKPEPFSKKILSGLGVDSYFFRILGEEAGFPKKPSPVPVEEVIRSAEALPLETVLVGDSDIDVQTGKNAGVRTVGVTYGFGDLDALRNSSPDLIVNDLGQLMTHPWFC